MSAHEKVGLACVILGVVTYLLGPIEAWVWFWVGGLNILLALIDRFVGGD